MSNQHSLEGKTAVVTGAAHPRGMGAAACRKLAALGAHVVATDLSADDNIEKLKALCAELGGDGRSGEWAALDVTDPASIEEVFDGIANRGGGVDVLFNNAGLGIGVGPFLDQDEKTWDAVWRVNVMGAVNCCRAAIPQMQTRGDGVIINNASLAGLGVVSEMAGYSTTKFAVVGLTKSIAAEFGKDGIRCNAVCPGSIRTAMYDLEVRHRMDTTGQSRVEVERELDALSALGRSASADEVADAVAYLASPAASFITGVALPVAGGMAQGL